MDLFGIGFGEIILILIVALIIFGPGRLPEIARTVGKFTRDVKKMSSDFTSAVTKEIDLAEEEKKKPATEASHLPPPAPADVAKSVESPASTTGDALPTLETQKHD